MTKYSEMARELDLASRPKVIARDRGACIVCGKKQIQVHEILPKSKFGLATMEVCYREKNRVCLCVEHHHIAHTLPYRKYLFKMMQEKFGYNYSEEPFKFYLGE